MDQAGLMSAHGGSGGGTHDYGAACPACKRMPGWQAGDARSSGGSCHEQHDSERLMAPSSTQAAARSRRQDGTHAL